MLRSAVLLAIATLVPSIHAAPLVHSLFTDHMVIQRDKKIPIWGWAKPNQRLNVAMLGQTISAVAQESGKWQAQLGPFPAGGPHTLTIKTDDQQVTFKDVLVGDVWICSGQSNMEWSVTASKNPNEEIKNASHPQIRLFTVPRRVSLKPEKTVDGKWSVCTPNTIRSFSAVGYYFGRELHQELKVPIGLIHTSWGGTVAEAWTSANALEQIKDFEQPVELFRSTVAAQESEKFNVDQMIENWWRKNDAGSKNNWADRDFDDRSWKEMRLPANWETLDEFRKFDGIMWFRKTFELPESDIAEDAELSLGPIDDADTTYVNGNQVGSMSQWNRERNYQVGKTYLKPGKNVIAIRVFDNSGGGGIFGRPEQMKLKLGNGKTMPLAGDWDFHVSTAKSKLPPFPARIGSNPNVVTVLNNGMLAPLAPFGMKGAIWYQGESNADRAMQYRRLLPAMIQDWRKQFDQGDFPFLIVQLANFMQQQQSPVESGWAELREAQALTAQRDSNVGLAITTDIGNATDIHPKNKQDVGKRLALSARKIAYAESDLLASGPTVKDMSIKGSLLIIDMENVGSGLEVRGEKLKGFAIAELDKKFVWADATIKGNSIVLGSAEIAEPIFIRYNWANNPIGNLFNKEGLPAPPFRTDRP